MEAEIEQKLMQGQLNLALKIQDLDTGVESTTVVRFYGNEEKIQTWQKMVMALQNTMKGMGLMDTEKKQKEEQPQDLTHHKTQETDVLVKAENPSDDFMKYNTLDKETHGKLEEGK